jgi:hypothetical protein
MDDRDEERRERIAAGRIRGLPRLPGIRPVGASGSFQGLTHAAEYRASGGEAIGGISVGRLVHDESLDPPA